MKNRWVKNLGLSLFLSFGLFFANGRIVQAEEEGLGSPEPLQELSDGLNQEGLDHNFLPSSGQEPGPSSIQNEPDSTEGEDNKTIENGQQPELDPVSSELNNPDNSDPIITDGMNTVNESGTVPEEAKNISQENTGSEQKNDAEMTGSEENQVESSADATISMSVLEGKQEENSNVGADLERTLIKNAKVMKAAVNVGADADETLIENAEEMKPSAKFASAGFAPAGNSRMMTFAAEPVQPEEENRKSAQYEKEDRFAYPGKSFPNMMRGSYGNAYRHTVPARTDYGYAPYGRFAGYRENRHFFHHEAPALAREEQPSVPAPVKADLPSAGSAASSRGLSLLRPELAAPAELIISGKDIPVINGVYSFRLALRSDRTLTFDNDLENTYQGINGDYQLHYDIDKEDNHTMIVDGLFTNIITASPLLDTLPKKIENWVSNHISDDSYLYQLVLVTKEGFTFENALKFLYDKEREAGLSVKYAYDLLTDKFSMSIDFDPIWCDLKLKLGFTA